MAQELIPRQEYEMLLGALKERIRSAQLDALRSVNREKISLYTDIGIPGATEQKTRLRNPESSSIASDELRRGRSCPRWTASGTEKA